MLTHSPSFRCRVDLFHSSRHPCTPHTSPLPTSRFFPKLPKDDPTHLDDSCRRLEGQTPSERRTFVRTNYETLSLCTTADTIVYFTGQKSTALERQSKAHYLINIGADEADTFMSLEIMCSRAALSDTDSPRRQRACAKHTLVTSLTLHET